jgi:hypothetical protein
MSEENKGAPAPEGTAAAAPVEEIKNLKAEMNRKMGNLEQTNAQLLKQLETMLASTKPAPSPEPKKNVSVFEDEEGYARRIKEETAAEIRAEMAKEKNAMAKQQTIISSLVTEFPELNQGDSTLTKKAVELYNGMADDEKASPVAYKAAVNQAALELGIKPKSKRSADDSDDYVFSGSGTSEPAQRKRKASDSELDPRTEQFAQLVGLELTKEVKERLTKKHGRKSYSRWE